jgi:hypothetical protein
MTTPKAPAMISLSRSPAGAIGALRSRHRLMRTLAAFVCLAFTLLILAPTAAAARAASERRVPAVIPGAERELAATLSALRMQLAERDDRPAAGPGAVVSAVPEGPGPDPFATLRQRLDTVDPQVDADFERIGQWIGKEGLPAPIAARHREAQVRYQAQMAQLRERLDGITGATEVTERKNRSLPPTGRPGGFPLRHPARGR